MTEICLCAQVVMHGIFIKSHILHISKCFLINSPIEGFVALASGTCNNKGGPKQAIMFSTQHTSTVLTLQTWLLYLRRAFSLYLVLFCDHCSYGKVSIMGLPYHVTPIISVTF